jgi:hypothetical protein
MEYVFRLHKEYQYPIDYVWNELPMDLGWQLYSYAYGNDALNRFGGLNMVTSPMSIEADSIKSQLNSQIK